MAVVDLATLTRRIAQRGGGAEANVQADIRTLLLYGGLNLSEHDLAEVVLEAQAGGGRRIDIEVGFTVIETKRDLRAGRVREDAEVQLAGYVRSRTRLLGQRYVGILTDGAEWRLYHLEEETLLEVAHLELAPTNPDPETLIVWLEGALATVQAIEPTPVEIERRLGASSTAHALDHAELSAIYEAHRDHPTVKLKRELWARLLRTAFGTSFEDDDRLFVDHSLLVATAEVIAHAVVGLNPTTLAPASVLSGQQFAQAGISGVVEEDFFDWIVEVPEGERFVRTLARRLMRFSWGRVEHDVMKVLYESVIDTEQRHRLGEYYTPDWLAEKIVLDVVDDPLSQRVLDPACGSGTFVFHAVRRYLRAAAEAGITPEEAIIGATRRVLGVDVHPLAVAFARVTYLLAIGRDLLQMPGRPDFHVPVYLGDSVQWRYEANLLSHGHLSIQIDDGAQLFASELRFPDRLLEDAGRFDQLVAELADRAADRRPGAAAPPLAATFQRFAVHPSDQPILEATFRVMCQLHDEGRDHVWSYYVRNLARPTWLARDENRVDRIVGNPPWLAYRFMTSEMQATFRQMSEERGLWAGATVATHQDLSGLFLLRAVELYLKPGGRFGLVMPLAALSRRQFEGLRTGRYASPAGELTIAFDTPWDLHGVKPNLFRVPPSVVFGSRAARPVALTHAADAWSGRLPFRNVSWSIAEDELLRVDGRVAVAAHAPVSPYHSRFRQGATFVPRMLHVVEDVPVSPIGVAQGRRAVRSHRSANEKAPWRHLPSLEGVVESEFVRPLHLGATLLPFRVLDPLDVVTTWYRDRLLDASDDTIDLFPGLAQWWRDAVSIWNRNNGGSNLGLLERVDYRRGLSLQFSTPGERVVYGASGQYLAAARVADSAAVIDTKLYWASVTSTDEARYLTAILNAPTVTRLLAPMQSRGEHNPRDFHKVVWRLPIPIYDAADGSHLALARLAERAERVAESVDVSSFAQFERKRRLLREALEEDGVSSDIDRVVTELLGRGGAPA